MNMNDRLEVDYLCKPSLMDTILAATGITIFASVAVYVFTGQAPAVVPYVQYGVKLYCEIPKEQRMPIRELINHNPDGNTIVITCKGD